MTTWTSQQERTLRDYTDLSNEDVTRLVNLNGPEKTVSAVDRRRRELGLPRIQGRANPARSEGARRAAATNAGWPDLTGSHEERDRIFVRMAVEEALQLGLLSTERAA